MTYFVYIIYSENFDKFYIGQTNDFNQRIIRHNAGYENATKPYLPWKMVCLIEKPSRSESIILEKKLKNLNRERLIIFIQKFGGRDEA
jgi:putative endonuclease